MFNWSVDTRYLQKHPKQYMLWRLEQLLSYGLDCEKIDKQNVKDNWGYLKTRLDPQRRNFIEYLLWHKQS